MAQAIALEVEGEAGNEYEVQVFGEGWWIHLRIGFFDSEGSFFEKRGLSDEVKCHLCSVEDEGVEELCLGEEGVQQGEIGFVRERGKSGDAASVCEAMVDEIG